MASIAVALQRINSGSLWLIIEFLGSRRGLSEFPVEQSSEEDSLHGARDLTLNLECKSMWIAVRCLFDPLFICCDESFLKDAVEQRPYADVSIMLSLGGYLTKRILI